MREYAGAAVGSVPLNPASRGIGSEAGASADSADSPELLRRREAPPKPQEPVVWNADDLSDVWTRAIGYGIDAVLLAVAGVLVGLWMLCLTPTWMLSRFYLYAGTSFALLLGVYCTGLVGGLSGTLGHRLFGLQVVRTDGSRVSYARACLRWAGYILCSLTAFIGFVIAVWDAKKQGLHDRLADTVVIGPRAPLATKIWASALVLAAIAGGIYVLTWLLGAEP